MVGVGGSDEDEDESVDIIEDESEIFACGGTTITDEECEEDEDDNIKLVTWSFLFETVDTTAIGAIVVAGTRQSSVASLTLVSLMLTAC